MTVFEVIEKIDEMYEKHQYRQLEIADFFKTDVSEIGYILRKLGYSRCKIVKKASVADVLKDSHARYIAEKLSCM